MKLVNDAITGVGFQLEVYLITHGKWIGGLNTLDPEFALDPAIVNFTVFGMYLVPASS